MTAKDSVEVTDNIEVVRDRVANFRLQLGRYFVDKDHIVDLMVICTLAQEPLLLVGKPGTAKSDLVVKFCQGLGLSGADYFEYMLTKFTEPSEIIGPVDINALKEGRYLRRVEGKLPEAKVVFLDEIFKANSAILNTLLTLINERKYYQDGKPVAVDLRMLFAATNEIPEFGELAALRDRFALKVESTSVRHSHFDELVSAGLRNDMLKVKNQRPWEGPAALSDFAQLKGWLDEQMGRDGDRQRFFPDAVYALFKRIIRTLEKEDGVEVSDRKVVKLYKLIRTRAFLHHGGVVQKEDLVLLRYTADRLADFEPVSDKVRALLRLDA